MVNRAIRTSTAIIVLLGMLVAGIFIFTSAKEYKIFLSVFWLVVFFLVGLLTSKLIFSNFKKWKIIFFIIPFLVILGSYVISILVSGLYYSIVIDNNPECYRWGLASSAVREECICDGYLSKGVPGIISESGIVYCIGDITGTQYSFYDDKFSTLEEAKSYCMATISALNKDNETSIAKFEVYCSPSALK